MLGLELIPSCFAICAYLKFLWWWLISWELPFLTVLWDVQLHPLNPHSALIDGTLDISTELPSLCRFVCIHGTKYGEKTATSLAHSGHQKNAATRDVLIYARQCLIIKIAFSTESTLKFNAGCSWQCTRTHNHYDEIQYPLAQQSSLLIPRPEREFEKPIYTGPRLATNLTSVAGQVFGRTDMFWAHKTSLSLQGTARPL